MWKERKNKGNKEWIRKERSKNKKERRIDGQTGKKEGNEEGSKKVSR